jgi:hypothetical protein
MGIHLVLKVSSGGQDTPQVLETTNLLYLAPTNGDDGQ